MTSSPQPGAAFNRRRFLGLTGAATLGLTAAACGTSGTGPSTPAGTGGTGAPAGGGGSLTIWANVANVGDATKGLQRAAADFAKAKGVTVNVQGQPTQDLVPKLTTATNAGSGPDIAVVDSSSVPQLAAGNVLTDLSAAVSAVKGDFLPDAWAYSQYNKKQFGLPYYTNCVVLYYNKAMFAKAGASVPTTWADLETAAKGLTGGGQYGYMMGPAGYGSFLFWPWLWQNGGQILADDGSVAFNSDAGKEAFTTYANLVLKDKVAPPEFVAATASWDAVIAPFVQGKVAMLACGPWAQATIAKGGAGLDWDVAPLAVGKQAATVLGGATIGVTSSSKNAALATEFLTWVTGKDQVDYIQATGNIPGRTDIVGSSWATGDPKRKVFVDQLKNAKVRPTLPTWGAVEWGVMADAWDAVIHGQKQPIAALNDAASASAAKLKG